MIVALAVVAVTALDLEYFVSTMQKAIKLEGGGGGGAHHFSNRSEAKKCGPTLQDATVDSVCRCLWQRTCQSSHTPMTAIWNSADIREHVHQAAYKSLKECWSWEGALDGLHKETFSNLTDAMLDLLKSRLPHSIKTRPHPFVMERVLEVIIKRMQDPLKYPPLRIAVFGGSVTEGFNSRTNSINISNSNKDPHQCTWSCRLERLLNEVLPIVYFGENLTLSKNSTDTSQLPTKQKLVEVRNFAVGGSDSSIGAVSLEYNVYGRLDVDIVISAYAANDLLAPHGVERDLIFQHMQNFHKLAKAQRPCSDLPLLIQLADVFEESLSNRQSIRHRIRYSTEMLETANWAGVMALSYPDVVRDLIYRNRRDTTLIEHEQLHPGMTFHTGIAWMIGYGLLEGSLQACDASSLVDHGKPEPRFGISYPVIRDDLRAVDVPEIWRNDTIALQQRCSNNQTSGPTCEYQFMANRLGASTAEEVRSAIKRVAINIDGWDGFGYPVRKPRRTWQAMHEKAEFTIQLENLTSPVNRMLVLVSYDFVMCFNLMSTLTPNFLQKYVKSYGVEWELVRLDLVVEGKVNSNDQTWSQLQKEELTGFHDSQTSINYSLQLDLGSLLGVGSSVRATFTLVKGAKFQINGIALCHSYQPINSIM